MRRVVVTGVGCAGPMGLGAGAFRSALAAGAPLGSVESVATLRGRARVMRVARLAPYDAEAYIPARRLRRMADVSRVWMTCCALARRDAGIDEHAGPPPERRGTFLGTGFGCIDATWDYLRGMLRDGPGLANPFLFSESVANAPAGHGAVELDARGPSVTFTCGDASAATAAAQAARAIRDDRIDLAWCGGVDLLVAPLLRVLAAAGAPGFVGEGGACLVLESADSARARGARIHAELAGSGMASDPRCAPADWSGDSEPLERAMRAAVSAARRAEEGPPRVDVVFLHAPGRAQADAAELRAVRAVAGGAATRATSAVVGALAAAGGFSLAAAALHAATARDLALVCASSWGGACAAVALRRAGPS